MKLPNEVGPIHFVGIGGIGMSGIAEVLINLGHAVQGSDASDNANVKRLRERGAKVFVGHDAANLENAAVVVVSTAIKRDNPELAAARAKRIPVVRRAEMLAELMRLKSCVAIAGTHGKTTTTALVATLLEAAGMDPTVINGGIINAYGANARLGGGDWMVVEADESDGTFLKLPADVAIVTNIDPEHLDHFKTFDAIKEAFLALIENLPFYGFAVMCLDHPTVQELVGRIEDRRVFTYGENPQADIRLLDVEMSGGVTRFAVLIRERATGRATYIDNLALPMPGRHNALNATAAIAVAHRLGASVDVIRKAIAGFGGVKRRFTRTGDWNGVTVYDDYGHHPVEIAAVLKAARGATTGKVIAVMQPHRFTRLASLFDAFATCFNDADSVLVADVYPAGEAPIEGVDKAHLVAAIGAHGHRHALALPGPEAIAPMVREMAKPGDIVVFLGAGTVTQWAYALPGELAALDGKAR
jgi:UDP-N-acetylmuramate--alanine ligase